MHRRLLSTAAALALTFGLAACGDENDGPATTPPPKIDIGTGSDDGGAEPSDAGGASDGGGQASDGGDGSSVAAPDIPAPDPADFPGMRERSAEGATEAFRYYIAVSMWAHQTGDTETLSSLETEDCASCSEFNKDVELNRERGAYWSPAPISDVGTQVHESDSFDHEIGYYFTLGPHTRPNEDSTEIVDVPELQYITVGGMVWAENEWKVGGLDAEWSEDAHDAS